MILIQAFSCWFMTGVIWLVQILIYPTHKMVGENEFKSYHDFHNQRITWIVAPVMAIELVTAIALNWQDRNIFYSINLVSVVIIWFLTGLVNVPSHARLSFVDQKSKIRLENLNWPRTLIWTARSFFWLWTLNHILTESI